MSVNPIFYGGPFMWRSLLLTLVLFTGCLQHEVNPDPDLTPLPVPPPVEPIGPGSLKVFILYESDDINKLPPAQVNAIQSSKLRAWFESHQADYRIWDQHTDVTHAEPFWQKAIKLPHGPLPWMWISANQKSQEGALPPTLEATLKLLDASVQP